MGEMPSVISRVGWKGRFAPLSWPMISCPGRKVGDAMGHGQHPGRTGKALPIFISLVCTLLAGPPWANLSAHRQGTVFHICRLQAVRQWYITCERGFLA